MHRLCSFSHSFTSRIQISDRTNILWVAIDNPRISHNVYPYFTATRRISIGSHSWMPVGKELVTLRYLRIHRGTIQSELRYLSWAKVAGTMKWKRGLGWARPKTAGLFPVWVANPPRQGGSVCYVVFQPDLGLQFGSNPDRSHVTGNRC